MGQYYKKSKIGTCEDMYYLRLDQAQELAKQGARDDDGISFNDYLTDNQTRFRFPFPDEDNKPQAELLDAPEYDRGFCIPAGVGGLEVGHDEITTNNSFKEGGSGVNIFLPCPYSQEFKNLNIKTSCDGVGEQWLRITQQAIRDGEEKTIFECARCGQAQRFSNEDIVKIKARAAEYFELYYSPKARESESIKKDYDNAMEIIKRIK
jgi:hypothetical protein